MKGRVLRVITYHRVGYPDRESGLNPRMISATPEAFRSQAAFLARRFAVLSAGDLLEIVAGEKELPKRAALISFDDGYRDVGEIAWPILESYGLPAVLFVATGFPDRPENHFWWDRLYRALVLTREESYPLEGLGLLRLEGREKRMAELKRVQNHLKDLPHPRLLESVERICRDLGEKPPSGNGVSGWEELRALRRDGLALASHTRSHCILPHLSREEVRQEVEGSQQDLEKRTGAALPLFSYPNGGHDEKVVEVLRECGFVLAFSTLDGVNDLSEENLLRLRRTNITPRTTPLLFRFRLSRQGARFDEWRRRS